MSFDINSKKYYLNENRKESEDQRGDEEEEGTEPWLRDECEIQQEAEVEESSSKIGGFRTVLPQILAVSSINLILLDLGMILAFPTIVIPALLKSTDSMRFTEEQASWFGSIPLICQPLGSTFSGLLFDPVGRKKTMLYVNIPLLAGWCLIYFGTSHAYLYLGEFIMGIGIGFMDAPHITYLGEITQPKWRGILTSYAGLFIITGKHSCLDCLPFVIKVVEAKRVSKFPVASRRFYKPAELCIALGFTFVFFLGTMADWKTVSATCSSVPVIAMLLISQIPESPIWLLSKGRKEEAKKSLCWLRGWVKPEMIQEEFSQLVRHNNSNCAKYDSVVVGSSGTESSNENQRSLIRKIVRYVRLRDVLHRSTFQPLLLVVIYFGFSHVAGVSSTRPFMVDILKEFGTPVDPNWITTISSIVGILGFVTGMILLPKTGKRLLSIISMVGCGLCNGVIFIYCLSFTHLDEPLIPVSFFIILNFLWCLGIGQIPWMLISEVFPFKTRGIASGISAAISYILAFIFTKTYYDMHNGLTLPGVFGFYGLCMILGSIFLFYSLPETEGKTLEQIESVLEDHFDGIRWRCGRKSTNSLYQTDF